MLVAMVLQSAFSSQMLLNRLNLIWFRRKTAYLMLTCYGVIALCGQGLHEFVDDDCDQPEQSTAVSVATSPDAEPLFVHHENGSDGVVIGSPSGGHQHDCDNCPICQFQAMGQHFVAPPPADNGLFNCEKLSSGRIELVYCPALYSVAQPRAPPIA
jgi:hypothetical protein